MGRFFRKIFHLFYNRKLRFDILTLFLTLFIVSVTIIISFSHEKNAREIMEFSKGTIQRVASIIDEKVECLVSQLEQMPTFVAGVLGDYGDITPKNTPLVSFMLTAVKAFPNLHALFLGTPEGNFIEAIDLTLIEHTHFLTDTSKPLPQGIAYALRVIEYSQTPPLETWYYKDASLNNTITKESFPTHFDPRVRPWYKEAEKTGQLVWADTYHYDPTGNAGIAVAMPIFNKKKEIIAVVGADLPLVILSHFLASQKIGKNGRAFILNQSGNMIVPHGISNHLVDEAYKKYIQGSENNFLLKLDKVTYLVHVSVFSPSFEREWLNVIIAPLDDFFGNLIKSRRQTVIISILILILSTLIVIYFSKLLSKPIVLLTKEVDKIKHLELQSEKRVRSHIYEITLLDESIASMRVMLRSFGRYVPKGIVKQLMEQGQEIALGGEKKDVTVFFSDIADFTPLAESLPIEEIMPDLSAYFDIISKIILNQQGTIDKYIGDSIMAFWGAPNESADQSVQACTAALLCQNALAQFNLKREKDAKPVFFTRIGIHTGSVIVGNIGTQERMNYTVMGDVVNEAARLQQVNKIYHTSILISEEVHKKIEDQFLLRPLDIVAVKGKSNKVKIYELMAKRYGEAEVVATSEQEVLSQLFSEAYTAYVQGERQSAKKLFELINNKFPNDYPTKLYMVRLQSESS